MKEQEVLMNESNETAKIIKEMRNTLDIQAQNVKTIKNCIVFFTVFMIISMLAAAYAYLYAL